MISKDDMRKLIYQMTDFLKTKGLRKEEILGTIMLMKTEAVANGIYKDEASEETK